MKNIHILPTDKLSRLQINTCFDNVLELWDEIDVPKLKQDKCIQYYHIYITSNEEIKEGDWIYYTSALGYCKTTVSSKGLEQEGIPAKKIILTTDQSLDGVQVIDDEFLEWFVKNPNVEKVGIQEDSFFGYRPIILKQETLEEAAEKFRSNNPGTMQGGNNTKILNAFKNGAKWQQERMYTEDEVKHLIHQACHHSGVSVFHKFEKWFEQFKKK